MNPQLNPLDNMIFQQKMMFQQIWNNQQEIQKLTFQIQNIQKQVEQLMSDPQVKMYHQFCNTRNLDPNEQNSLF